VRRGDWEEQKKAEADARMKEILDEMREEKAPPLEAVLGATGNSWARKKADGIREALNEIRREKRRRKY